MNGEFFCLLATNTRYLIVPYLVVLMLTGLVVITWWISLRLCTVAVVLTLTPCF